MTVGCRLAAMAGMLIAGEAAGFACARLSSAWPWMAGIGVLLALAAYGWHWSHVLPFFVFIFGFVAAARTDALRVVLLERHWRSGRGGTPPNLALKVEGTVRVFNRKDGGRSTQFSSHLGPIPLKVVLPLDGEMPPPAAGEVWRCMGWVSCKTLHGGRFERRMFWGKAGTRPVRLAMPSRTECRLAALAKACAARAAIGLGWCPDLAALNRAILLGSRSDLSVEDRATFARAGTIHVFAISGLHVMLLAILLHRLLALVGVPLRVRGLVVLPILAGYVLVTGLRPSAVRAAMMAGFYLVAPTFGRKGDSLAAWSLTALFAYGSAPERLFDTGCTLSFAVMLGIVAWLRWGACGLPSWCREGYGGECGVSLAAWMAGTPIVASVFGCFTPGGLLANLVVLRLAGWLVAFGMVGMACGFVLPPAAALFNVLAAAMSFLMVRASSVVAELPGSSIAVEPWSWSVCLAWYGTAGALVFLLAWTRRRQFTVWWLTKRSEPMWRTFSSDTVRWICDIMRHVVPQHGKGNRKTEMNQI